MEEEYLTGLEGALALETDPTERARLLSERGDHLKARKDNADKYAVEQAEWRRANKGKGKESEDDGEGLPMPVVTKLTKSQTERVKQLAEEERDRFGDLAREMRVPVELVLQTAHAQTAKSRGGPWNDFCRLYSAEHLNHGKSCMIMGLGRRD